MDRLADAVVAKLNGQLSGIRKDMEQGFAKVNDRLGKVEEAVSANSSKIDDLHRWMVSLNDRVADLEGDR